MWPAIKGLGLKDWGWTCTAMGLHPIATKKPPAPAELLKIIRCNCTTDCSVAAAKSMVWDAPWLVGSVVELPAQMQQHLQKKWIEESLMTLDIEYKTIFMQLCFQTFVVQNYSCICYCKHCFIGNPNLWWLSELCLQVNFNAKLLQKNSQLKF